MLADTAKIYVASGKGGDGLISFRREKYVPRGGPSGGDGGRGGDVIIQADAKINTLFFFKRRIHFKAEHGGKGGSSNKTGFDASPLIVKVPVGTIIRDADTGGLIADLVLPDSQVVVAPGGRGGKGNAHFKNSANQAPRVAEKGEPSVERWVTMELKLIADVGLVGIPNAGKSTLLSVVSNAKPKIADYPFTTLEPNLGTVIYNNEAIVFADIPGLIEGAHMGVGLGHAFLRHVQRTKMLIHLIDGSAENPIADFNQINTELALYDPKLGERPQIVVVNKLDLPEAQERWKSLKSDLEKRGVDSPMAISAATQENVTKLIQRVFETMSNLPEATISDEEEVPVYELPEQDFEFDIEVEDGIYYVSGTQIERAAAMTYWDYDEAVSRFQKTLETLGITKALETAGVQPGDTVFIGDYELEWSE